MGTLARRDGNPYPGNSLGCGLVAQQAKTETCEEESDFGRRNTSTIKPTGGVRIWFANRNRHIWVDSIFCFSMENARPRMWRAFLF